MPVLKLAQEVVVPRFYPKLFRKPRFYSSSPGFGFPDSDEVLQTDHLIIGGGVVGLATAYKMIEAKKRFDYNSDRIIIVERNHRVGEETSGRNSCVIHAGIYYPEGSFKEKLCIDGRHQLYDYCKNTRIPYKKIGKWIVAQKELEQIEYLHKLHNKGKQLNVPLEFVKKETVSSLEPGVKAELVLESKETGILDVAEYVQSLENQIVEDNSSYLATNSIVTHIYDSPFNSKACLLARVATGDESFWIETRNIINAAGLGAASIANKLIQIAGEWNGWASNNPPQFEYQYCKGNYFRYSGPSLANRLVYPVPDSKLTSLGLHLTLDLAGQSRFGPDVEFLDSGYYYDGTLNSGINLNYDVDENRLSSFTTAIKDYLPQLNSELLQPDYSGIRPKLSSGSADFVLRDECGSFSSRNHVINLVGIESPGLTSSLAIGDWVTNRLYIH